MPQAFGGVLASARATAPRPPLGSRTVEFAAVLLLAIVGVSAGGCHRVRDGEVSPSLKPAAFRGWNVLLVTIDTLRRERIGAYGSKAGLTPTLDRLAADGLCYTQTFSHAPMTLPAHASILTGLIPDHHGVRDNVSFRLDSRIPTLATALKGAGYRTGAFVGAFVLDGRFGLNSGFDTYDDRVPRASGISFEFSRRPAADVLQAAEDWIVRGRSAVGLATPSPAASAGSQSASVRPWFAWVHLYDPHAPYTAPPEFRLPGRAPYDAAVAYTDAALGRFLDGLRPARALDHTLVIVTADHGESLGDHGETTHGLFAYDATIAVPLIVWTPIDSNGGAIRPQRIATPAAHADIAPTVLDLTGVPLLPASDGTSLARPAVLHRVIRFEALDANLTRDWAPLTGIVQDGWKYIDLPVPELYSLSQDPGEQTNLARHDTKRFDTMERLFQDTAPAAPAIGVPAPVDTAAAARLRSLGYVGGSAPAGRRRVYSERDDPKALVGLSEEFATALQQFNDGQSARALDGFLRILRARPDFVTARTSAATILVALQRPADAVALLRDAPPEQRSSPDLLGKLGQLLTEAGDPRGAIDALEAARRAGNQNPDLLNALGVAYARLGRAADARSTFQALLKDDPGAAGTWYNLGLVEAQDRRMAAAVDAFRRATIADPSYAEAWQALGGALVQTDRAAAIDAWRRAERLRPNDYDLLFNLGMVLVDSGQRQQAVPYLERFVREAPRDRYGADVATVQRALAQIAAPVR